MKLHSVLLASFILVACQERSTSASNTLDDKPAGARGQILKGEDDKGKECSVEFISYSERKDTNITEILEPRRFTDLEKTVKLRIDGQHDPKTVFTVKSIYDTMWDAYEINRLVGGESINENRSEHVTVFLDEENQLSSVHYYRDAIYVLGVIRMGSKEIFCDLQP